MELPWPKRGDKPFKPTSINQPFLGIGGGIRIATPAGVFKDGAEAILKQMEAAESSQFNPEIILPVCFLYRHSLELLLKEIVRIGFQMSFFQKEDVETVMRGHSLAPIWTKARALIEDVWHDADKTPVKVTEAVINEFHQLDSSGQVFRYERDSNGKHHDYRKLEKPISPSNLREAMDAVYHFLDACRCGLDDLSSNLDHEHW